MRPTRAPLPFPRRHRRASLVVGLTLLASAGAVSCKSDNLADPSDPTAIPANLQPTGATIVCTFGLALISMAAARPLFRRRSSEVPEAKYARM